MMDISIRAEIKGLSKSLDALAYKQLPFAQDLADVFDGIAFDDSDLLAAGAVERGVFEGTHGLFA